MAVATVEKPVQRTARTAAFLLGDPPSGVASRGILLAHAPVNNAFNLADIRKPKSLLAWATARATVPIWGITTFKPSSGPGHLPETKKPWPVAWFVGSSLLRGVLALPGKQSMECGQNENALNRSQIRVEHRAWDVEGCRAHNESSCHGTGKAHNRVHHQIASLSWHHPSR